ncbi:MAG: hypothetical protein OXP12_03835 [Thaumarchaeota archaeon]|nr:hypothetical protein [Nitrososphaerota archaeon]
MHKAVISAAVIASISLLWGGGTEGIAQEADPAEIKIGVLTSDPVGADAGLLAAIEIAKNDLNREYAPIHTVTLRVIDVSDHADRASLEQKIGAALRGGFTHFVGPNGDVALMAVKYVLDEISPDSIIVSPGSRLTGNSNLDLDDNLFRLSPNSDTMSQNIVAVFDKYDAAHLLVVVNSRVAPFLTMVPDDLHGHYVQPLQPIGVYDGGSPSSYARNVQSAMELHSRLAPLIAAYGEERAGVYAIGARDYANMANVLGSNPLIDNPGKVRWYGSQSFVEESAITSNPTVAEFSAKAMLTAVVYDVGPNDVNAALDHLPSLKGLQGKTNNYAAYDSLRLLADSIAVGGADHPNLKQVVFDVADGKHALPHTDRLLGRGALGDYKLDPMTGDLLEGGTFAEHRLIKTDGGYDWRELAILDNAAALRMCR